MKPTKGYFCLVQFCPNPSRLETVNVGVLLFCPESGFLDAQMSGSSARARRFFGRDQVELAGLKSALKAFRKRLSVDRASFSNRDDLQRFVETRANLLQLTEPRAVKVFDPAQDLRRLFKELVGGRSESKTQRPAIPQLDTFFERLISEGRARRNVEVSIPVMNRRIVSQYGYQNGVDNYVVRHDFSARESASLTAAGNLAIEGDLLRRHTEKSRLIVVTSYDTPEAEDLLQPRVDELFREYEVDAVGTRDLPAFLQKVDRDAH